MTYGIAVDVGCNNGCTRMKNKKKPGFLFRHRFGIACVCAAFFAVATMVLFLHGNYPRRILARLFPPKPAAVSRQTVYHDPMLEAWENCLDQLHIQADIVFFGDSLIKRGEFDSLFPDKTICNLGLDGEPVIKMADRVDMIASVSPSKVFIMGGINSLKDYDAEQCIQDYEELLSAVSENVDAEVFIVSVLPVSADRMEKVEGSVSALMDFNDQLRSLTLKYGYTYVDLFAELADEDGYIRPEYTTDGVHLTDEGYEVWGEVIGEYVG